MLRELLLHRAARAKEAAVRLADQGQLAAAQGALAEELGTLREALTSDTQFGRADRALLEQELSQSRSLRDEFDEGSYSSLTRKQALMQSLLSRKKRGAYDARPPSS